VRWRPLLSAHSRKRRASDKSFKQSFDVLRSSKWRLSSLTFSFCGRRRFSAVSHPKQCSIATRHTVVPMNIEVPTKYPLSHNDRTVVLEISLHSESPMVYRPALHGNWNALSLTRRALKDKSPKPTIPLTAVLPNRQVFLLDPVYNTGTYSVTLLKSWHKLSPLQLNKNINADNSHENSSGLSIVINYYNISVRQHNLIIHL